MIHYQLNCDADHEFDGWFKGSESFELQAGRGLITCPVCASTAIRRALMAPGIRRQGPVIDAETERPASLPPASTALTPNPAPDAAANARAGGKLPDQIRAALSRLRGEIEKNCDYVGADFAGEARRIHSGKAPARGIYGESTRAEAQALAEDGIGVAQIPWLPRADS